MPRKPSERIQRIRCPVCKKSGDWFAGKYGPFCSHRCKLIDPGKWLGEEHTISGPLPPEHPAKLEEA
ncbi:MAG TPA: DNA gyrase inhibitor YacG [Verrucomicrobiae bacterium]|nr:DNA gyrase inhibitor YacG [Verrucomicrobiae bacterium]